MNKLKCLSAACLVFASACTDQIIDDNTTSRFVTPEANGAILSPGGATGGFTDSFGQGYAFKAGSDGDGIAAVAGVIPGTVATEAPTSGTIRFEGNYQLVSVGGFFLDDGNVVGISVPVAGPISLNGNFDDGTLRGSADRLSIDGRISGNALSGNVEYDGVEGKLTGVIGANKAVGAFHGNDEDDIYAGGFYATARTD
ncbi:hypothetical protein [Yoonia sediminilitoris]|uniref:Transferrin-binding protein B C-lobe/N-lobe beta barrel domain-containing protein n=1 Tax=Yoonia sediminilitoris TaxID=1286148 RepID=A0A2T6KK97_9RHOB|nr:hypothetical protein [Yoonia sediminilitoris]PUB16383.1 hypothetical protein C8N45_103238 [Yoonia sediminilitoris]RCW96732.1 hypothetical protein DFP92_103238 [Yoonia sediminilitoris]